MRRGHRARVRPAPAARYAGDVSCDMRMYMYGDMRAGSRDMSDPQDAAGNAGGAAEGGRSRWKTATPIDAPAGNRPHQFMGAGRRLRTRATAPARLLHGCGRTRTPVAPEGRVR